MQEELSFGAWLRKQRRALDLSRQAFADQVGCAEVTLRRLEAGSLKPSTELAGLLLEKLGIPEAERPPWIAFARGVSDFPFQFTPPIKNPVTNLPAHLTSFIGREKEQSEVIRLIAKHRLVTLTGSGGVGKTRLSIRVGKQILKNYPAGVWLVELAPIQDPLLIPRTTAFTLGLRDEPQSPIIDMLCAYLQDKELLIILDNCEHLVDACAQIAQTLLKHCLGLHILVTSREVLGMLGEAAYRVPSLELPDTQESLEDLRCNEAARLFEERAQLAQMNFSLTVENAAAVTKICAHLDGIPLAIELAAARVSTLGPEQIAARLQENLSLLTTGNRSALPRHQTLQAAIDWSYDLLWPAEQTLFQRLSVFVDGWTVEAAESICSDANLKSDAILALLTQLINKSLVMMDETPTGPRYRFHETIGQYANGKLIESGENDVSRDKHLEYFLDLVKTAKPHLIKPEQLDWLPLLDADYENLQLALAWALNKDTAEPSLNLCESLGLFWDIRCYWVEGLNWLTRALAKTPRGANKSEKVARSRALAMKSYLEVSNAERILSAAEASLALALEVSDKRDTAIAKLCVGNALLLCGEEYDRAHFLLEQSFAEFQALNEPFWEALSFHALGVFLAREGKLKFRDLSRMYLELARKAGERTVLANALLIYADWLFRDTHVDMAKEYAEEADRLYKQVEPKRSKASYLLRANIAWSNGDTQTAKSFYREMLEHFRLLGEQVGTYICLGNLGLVAMEEQDLDGAQTYLEQALGLIRGVGLKFYIAECLMNLGNLSYLKGDLGQFKQEFRESLSLKEYFDKSQKAWILMTILGSLYFEKPECSAQLLGIIDNYEKEDYFPFALREKRYCVRAEAHARGVLGKPAFEAAFVEGQKLSLDEGLGLALKTVEAM